MSYETIESKLAFHGKILDVYQDKVSMPNGDVAKREYVVRGSGASAIVPVDDQGNILFVRQYRHPVRQMTLEIPAGVLEEGEDPLVCASRELEEEVGYRSDNITLINEMFSAIGICSEKIYIYLARNLKEGKQHFDPDEFIEVERYSLEESVKMVFDGRITDSKTMVGVLAYQTMVEKGL